MGKTGKKKPKYFLIDKIVGQRNRNGKVEYLLRWKGYSSKSDSWVTEDCLRKNSENTPKAKKKVAKSRPLKTQAKKSKEKVVKIRTEKGDPLQTYYVIEKMLARRVVNQKAEYLVHWKGYPADESSWEPEDRLKRDYVETTLKQAFIT